MVNPLILFQTDPFLGRELGKLENNENLILQNIHLQEDKSDRLTACCKAYIKSKYNLLVISKGFDKNPVELLALAKQKLLSRPAPLILQVREDIQLSAEHARLVADFVSDLEKVSPDFLTRIFPLKSGVPLPADRFISHLKEGLELIGVIGDDSIDSEVVAHMCRALQTTFDSCFSSKIVLGAARKRSPDTIYGSSNTSMIEIDGGGFTLAILLSIPETQLVPIVEKMLGEDALKENPELTMSVPCEVMNILAGLGRASLNDMGYQLRPATFPRLVTPEMQPMLTTYDQCAGVELDFESNVGKLVFEVRFYC
jgi:hypothetical protein